LEDFFHSVDISLGHVPFPTFPYISMISLSFNNIITLQALRATLLRARGKCEKLIDRDGEVIHRQIKNKLKGER
jgi:hypothetical protein